MWFTTYINLLASMSTPEQCHSSVMALWVCFLQFLSIYSGVFLEPVNMALELSAQHVAFVLCVCLKLVPVIPTQVSAEAE